MSLSVSTPQLCVRLTSVMKLAAMDEAPEGRKARNIGLGDADGQSSTGHAGRGIQTAAGARSKTAPMAKGSGAVRLALGIALAGCGPSSAIPVKVMALARNQQGGYSARAVELQTITD